MIITVTDKKARLELTTDYWYETSGLSAWEAVQNVLLSAKRDYQELNNVKQHYLTEDAQTSIKLLKEIME